MHREGMSGAGGPAAPNQLWVTDLTYVPLADGRFAYTAL